MPSEAAQQARTSLIDLLEPFNRGMALPPRNRERFDRARRDLGGYLGMLQQLEEGASWVTPEVARAGSARVLETLTDLVRMGTDAGLNVSDLQELAEMIRRQMG